MSIGVLVWTSVQAQSSIYTVGQRSREPNLELDTDFVLESIKFSILGVRVDPENLPKGEREAKFSFLGRLGEQRVMPAHPCKWNNDGVKVVVLCKRDVLLHQPYDGSPSITESIFSLLQEEIDMGDQFKIYDQDGEWVQVHTWADYL